MIIGLFLPPEWRVPGKWVLGKADTLIFVPDEKVEEVKIEDGTVRELKNE